MTEKEAKTKWCPFARSEAGDPSWPSFNRFFSASELPASTLCIGSACVAWRLGEPVVRTESRGPEGGYRKVAVTNGFCGLAGQP